MAMYNWMSGIGAGYGGPMGHGYGGSGIVPPARMDPNLVARGALGIQDQEDPQWMDLTGAMSSHSQNVDIMGSLASGAGQSIGAGMGGGAEGADQGVQAAAASQPATTQDGGGGGMFANMSDDQRKAMGDAFSSAAGALAEGMQPEEFEFAQFSNPSYAALMQTYGGVDSPYVPQPTAGPGASSIASPYMRRFGASKA